MVKEKYGPPTSKEYWKKEEENAQSDLVDATNLSDKGGGRFEQDALTSAVGARNRIARAREKLTELDNKKHLRR